MANEFNFALALAKGTPENPLIEPEDLLAAKISKVSNKSIQMGIKIGQTGKEALEIMNSYFWSVL